MKTIAAALALFAVGCTYTAAPLIIVEQNDSGSDAEPTKHDAEPDAPSADGGATEEAGDDVIVPGPITACTYYAGATECTDSNMPKLYACPTVCPHGTSYLANSGYADGGLIVWCCGS